MPESYQKKTAKITKAIIHLLEAQAGKKPPPQQMIIFIKEFYRFAALEDILHTSTNELLAIVSHAYDFFQKRTLHTPHIRVFNPDPQKIGYGKDRTVIEILNDDSPFLVDSVTEVVTKLENKLFRIIHPVFSVYRSKEGKFKQIASESGAGARESLMHFEISRINDPSIITQLEQDIKTALHTVHLAVTDWRAMVEKLDCTIQRVSDMLAFGDFAKLDRSTIEEAIAFLHWLKDNNFVFLGYVEYDFVDANGKDCLDVVKNSELGIFKEDNPDIKPKGLRCIPPELLHFVKNPSVIELTKANSRSRVHRPVHMDYIGVKRLDKKGKVVGEFRFLGLFTSIVYYQSANLIPIIREKIDTIVQRANFPKGGHSAKELVAVLESFPRDELFQTPTDELFETCMGIVSLASRPRVRLFVRKDQFERFLSCIIFVPRDNFSTQLRRKMQIILEKSFNGTVVNHYTHITDSHLARLNVIVKINGNLPSTTTSQVESELARITSRWTDHLQTVLIDKFGEIEGDRLHHQYQNAFPVSYQEHFIATAACFDIETINTVYDSGRSRFDLYQAFGNLDLFHLKIYHPTHKVSLSDITPTLEKMALFAEDVATYTIQPSHQKEPVWIYHFHLRSVRTSLDLESIKDNFEVALAKVWTKAIEDDRFNQLVLLTGLNWREIVILRAYSKYLRQIGFTYSQDYIEDALATHPQLCRQLVELFETRFNPTLKTKREKNTNNLLRSIHTSLTRVTNLAEDRIITRFVDLIMATLRTNYYQTNVDGNIKEWVSFKFNSALIPELPLPKPYREIFVYSPYMEGIHLRGGKVARGGLRWSDRHVDFRTEILGLMKAQMTKNTVIVPVGSKGGFIVKKPPLEGGRDALVTQGIRCYQTFLRGLLDITDNVVRGEIIPPKEVVRYDDDDPYLVVAADKGTATFSDIANDISAEYHFWLGDAFASGGSNGYDHKKMGITARGAWVSVQRHFREMGIDVQKEPFTVIGIGDMAGDVFGNGMLLSEHIKLVGAFNHMHIFIDPNPNCKTSFKERQRLFNTPGTSWADYNSKLISKGGGVFERSTKSIKLSAEIRKLLGITETSLPPEKLIKAMLLAKVDLLWNGGIGTYVKASTESDDEVGDRANDNLRVNGKQLRCKVIGEGGNLGLTQKGRIEYAKKRGRINTDSIDNSAGVDCSDNEVNIKILLSNAIAAKKLNMKDRNKLLESMTSELAISILRDNYLQTQAISIADEQGHKLLESQARLIQKLEQTGLLNRAIEFLPDAEEIARRHADDKGLTRPEISVLLAYSKLFLYEELLNSNVPDADFLEQELVQYFPTKLQNKFKKEITKHPLRREIITTCITNDIVNRTGTVLLHHLEEDTGMKWCDIARAFLCTSHIFDLNSLWHEIEALDGKISTTTQVELFTDIQSLIERSSLWFLRNVAKPIQITHTVNLYKDGVKTLSNCLQDILAPTAAKVYQQRFKNLTSAKIPTKLAKRMAGLEAMSSACDIVQVAKVTQLSTKQVGGIYFEVGTQLSLGWLRQMAVKLSIDSHWQRLSHKTLINDLFDQQRRLTAEVIRCCGKSAKLKPEQAVEMWRKRNASRLVMFDDFIRDVKAQENMDFSMLVVSQHRVETLFTS